MKRRNRMKTLLAATLVCASMAFAGEGAAIKANKKSKKYHRPACRHYNAKGSTVEFKSEQEARDAGYKSCKKCGKAKAKAKKTEAEKKK